MEQSTKPSCGEQSSPLDSATGDEISVAEILLELSTLISLTESLSKSNWGCKRKRSCLDEAQPLAPAPSPLPPSVQRTDDKIEERRMYTKAEEEKGAAAGTTASPNTPLAFPPSESDEKPKYPSKNSSRKRSRQEYLDRIEELNQRKDLLRGEIENVKMHYNKLKAYNSQLKALKQELLNTCLRKEEAHMVPHQQPLTADPTMQNFQHPFSPIATQSYPANNGIGSVNDVGPSGIDLNISAEEGFGVEPSQPLDVSRVLADKRARFAEARRRRRGMIKIKSMRSSCGIKLPSTR